MYSGYYTFAMTKDGQTKDVHAKFTYIYRMTAQGVKIVTHNSGITPTGAVEESARAQSYILREEVQKTYQFWLLTFWLIRV